MLKILLRAFSVLAVIAVLAAAWLVIDYRQFLNTPLALGGQALHYDIAPGTGVKKIAQDLERRGVVKHWFYLAALARLQGQAHQIKAGEYEFIAGTTPTQLLDQLVAGRVLEYSFTLVEGWTFRQLLEALRQNTALQHTLTGLNDAQIMERLGWPGQHPEGRFLPDTYRFPKGTTDAAFLQRAYRAMSERLESEWRARSPEVALGDPYQALILASIVEKESARPEERAVIAGVFLRRLERGMRLQTDPTVIYGMGAGFDGDIRRRDLRADTPYNTYVREGLPPTPIAMPGADALHAALHPAPGASLYFVSRGDGSHEFSDTLEAHNKAVQKYQLSNTKKAEK
ncbi:MAG: endolytic transglycosylase MltG [Pseudomonadota bacterium]